MDHESLSPDELAYHGQLVASLRAAQAAWQSWSNHLSAKYHLSTGEGIDEDGSIHRLEAQPEED